MMINERESRGRQLQAVAEAMMTAARTAPKACGVDNLEIAAITGDDIASLADTMRGMAAEPGRQFFGRDAANVSASEAVVLIGTRISALGLDCALCGYERCADKPAATPCIFNTNDLGIAAGSAVSVAAGHRVDTRIMFSAGEAARSAGLLPKSRIVLAIPLSCSGKSPFFDRK